MKSLQRILLNTRWVLAQLSSHPILGRLNQLLAKREIEKIRLPIPHKCWPVGGVTCLLTPLVSVVGTRTVAKVARAVIEFHGSKEHEKGAWDPAASYKMGLRFKGSEIASKISSNL